MAGVLSTAQTAHSRASTQGIGTKAKKAACSQDRGCQLLYGSMQCPQCPECDLKITFQVQSYRRC